MKRTAGLLFPLLTPVALAGDRQAPDGSDATNARDMAEQDMREAVNFLVRQSVGQGRPAGSVPLWENYVA